MEGKRIKNTVKFENIHFSRLRLVYDPPRLVKTLQGKGIAGEISVRT